MNREFHFSFNYRPVGQGLFASGSIWRRPDRRPCFSWVYDCGSSDSPHCLTREIERLEQELGDYGTIDVLILSHFDQDHVNGVDRLLRRFRINRLFIPYIPIEKRLAIVLDEPAVGFGYLQALINPARHFVEGGGDNLGEVIYITDGGQQGGPPMTEGGIDLPPEGALSRMVKFPDWTDTPPDGEAGGTAETWEAKTRYISDGHGLTIPGLWEFVFYNKKSKRADDDFIAGVKAILNSWQWGDRTGGDATSFVTRLKAYYDDTFPAGRARNDISLVTYSGPIYPSWRNLYACTGKRYNAGNVRAHSHRSPYWFHCGNVGIAKASHLYFGDLTLTPRLLDRLIRPHIREERWSRILTIQVPHHGADPSWFSGASLNFSHHSSIFSYGVHNSYKHPGKMVRKDLEAHGPIRVNELRGAFFCGVLSNR